MHYDVAVIGCGITGAALAYELSQYQLDCVVLERENDVADATTKANSAIIHAGYDPEEGTLMARLNVRGAALAGQLCRDLDVPYQQIGSLVLAFDETDERTLRTLYARGLANGVPGLTLLSGDEVRKREPALSPNVRLALYAPSAGIVSPWEYALALAETAVRNGVEIRLDSGVEAIEMTGDGYLLHTPSGTLHARYVVNAAGLYADRVHALIGGDSFVITPSKGEYHLLDKSEGRLVRHVIFQCPTKAGKGVLISPTVHGNLIVGPNAAPAKNKEDAATSRAGLDEIYRAAKKSVPALSLGANIRNFAGNRANAGEADFIIRPSEVSSHFINLAGIKSPGLSCAPAIAEMCRDILRRQGLTLQKKARFHHTRKKVRMASLSPAEKNARIKENPAYGRIICRCESISEGEILDAIHSPIPPVSVDGVKRRANAGMGRCQGGFCSPRVVELISRELGITPLDVVQDKTGSYLLTGRTKEEKENA